MAHDVGTNEFFKDFILKRGRFESQQNKEVRIKRIASFSLKEFSTIRVLDYYEESKSNYINGCFRSCIISSAIAIDQILKYLLISTSEDWEETFWEIEMKKLNFCKLIERIQKTKMVSKEILDDAHWLRQARNEIAAHPMYIGHAFELKEPCYVIPLKPDVGFWSNKVMLRDIRKLLCFIEPEQRKKFEEEKISSRNSSGELITEISLNDFFLRQEFGFSNFIMWGTIQETILEELAFEAYIKAVKIINAVLLTLENKTKKEKLATVDNRL